MIVGETVVLHRREVVGTDPGNNPIIEWTTELVEDVLVAPGPRDDIDGRNRLEGVEVIMNLHFPKTFKGSLRGCEISVRDLEPAPVVGDPQPYTNANTPGKWNRPVELARIDG